MFSKGKSTVINSRKLNKKAIPETIQKFLSTGTAVIAPIKKAIDSHKVAVRMAGPTSFIA